MFSFEVVNELFIDAVCIGEGEEAIMELADKIRDKKIIHIIHILPLNGFPYTNQKNPDNNTNNYNADLHILI